MKSSRERRVGHWQKPGLWPRLKQAVEYRAAPNLPASPALYLREANDRTVKDGRFSIAAKVAGYSVYLRLISPAALRARGLATSDDECCAGLTANYRVTAEKSDDSVIAPDKSKAIGSPLPKWESGSEVRGESNCDHAGIVTKFAVFD